MNFISYLQESLLIEGGAAIKGASRVTQVEARHVIPDLISKISKVTGVDKEKIKSVGSAGHKPADTDTSGDIDIAIECDVDVAKNALKDLAYDHETFKAMSAINVYSFATKVNGKIVQVDLIPVENVNFAVWSFISDEDDLAKGLKGAQRNEVIFAVTKHADLRSKKNDNGDIVEMDRYFFDLSKGLMKGHQTRYNSKGKLTKNFTTTGKELVSNDPEKVAKILFGKKAKASKLVTFDQVWEAINSPDFPFKDSLDDIIKMTKSGIEKKNLKVPDVLL